MADRAVPVYFRLVNNTDVRTRISGARLALGDGDDDDDVATAVRAHEAWQALVSRRHFDPDLFGIEVLGEGEFVPLGPGDTVAAGTRAICIVAQQAAPQAPAQGVSLTPDSKKLLRANALSRPGRKGTFTASELYTDVRDGGRVHSIPDDSLRSLESIPLPELVPEHSQEAVVQAWWAEFARVWNNANENASPVLHDTHNSGPQGMLGKRPDGIATCIDSATLFSLLWLVELKAGNHEFSNADKGELIEYAEIVLTENPFRTHVFSVLMNTRRVLLMKSCRQLDERLTHYIVAEEPLEAGQEGPKVLSWLLRASEAHLGRKLPKVTVQNAGVSLTGMLGSGASADVFQGSFRGEDCAVKVFKSGQESRFRQERAALEALADVPNVPTLVAVGEAGGSVPVLLETPIGTHFGGIVEAATPNQARAANVLGPDQITTLVRVLRDAHERGFVHCDVWCTNYFVAPNNQVILNDWGTACRIGSPERASYAGVGEGASSVILRALQLHNPVPLRPEDDLHALARSVFRLLFSPPAQLFYSDGQYDWEKIEAFWVAVEEESEAWRAAFAAAEKRDYEGVERALHEIVATCGMLYKWHAQPIAGISLKMGDLEMA